MKQSNFIFSLLLCFTVLVVIGTQSIHGQDIVVSKDGSGDYSTVQAAINAAPSNSASRTEIYIKNGTYYEVITIASNKTNLTFIGESQTGTVLTYNNYSSKINPETGSTYGTSGSSSIFINGAGFFALNLTFSNTSGPVGQAVAVRSTADKVIFKNCSFLGYQDTYYPHSGRSYHENCYIEGTTDFIFGGAISFFENCQIYSKGGTSLTAASTPQHIAYGYVFNNCQITGSGSNITDLGRPWRPYASVTFMNTSISNAIKAAGWNDWGDSANQSTARFSEYNNSGSGYVPGSRVSWANILSSSQAQSYTMSNVLKANSSNPQVTDNWDPNVTINGTGGSNTLTIQENQTGFCSVNGTIDTNNSGFTGTGFANTDNVSGNGITWSVNAPSSGTYTLLWRYANGGSTNRTAQVMINGSTQVSNVNFTSTSSWTSWVTQSGTNVTLQAGTNLIRLQATNSSGLANIDYIEVTGNTPTAIACTGSALRSTVTLTTISESYSESDFISYPNPVNKILTIALGVAMRKGAIIQLYDNTGRIIINKPVQNAKPFLDMGDLQSGIYFLKVSNSKTSIVKHIIKQ